MCTFISTLPSQSKTAMSAKKQNIFLSMRACPADDPRAYYKFRLLNFSNPKSTRDFPWIEMFEHTVWGKTDDGKPIITERVTCPVTSFVEWDGNRYDCPICKFANNHFISYKESGYKDKESSRKSKEFGRKFMAYIPVYVVNDPNYEANNGKFKVIAFSDKNQYKEFKDLVSKKIREVPVFNGVGAVDFCIRLEQVTETVREGEPNEYTWKHTVIKHMTFTNTPKDIPAITKEAIDKFPFDDQYYIASTKDEIDAFYRKYCKVQMDDFDIPGEETINVFTKPAAKPAEKKADPTPKVNISNDIPQPPATNTNLSVDDIDDILGSNENEANSDPISEMPFDTGSDSESKETENIDDINVDDLLADI